MNIVKAICLAGVIFGFVFSPVTLSAIPCGGYHFVRQIACFNPLACTGCPSLTPVTVVGTSVINTETKTVEVRIDLVGSAMCPGISVENNSVGALTYTSSICQEVIKWDFEIRQGINLGNWGSFSWKIGENYPNQTSVTSLIDPCCGR